MAVLMAVIAIAVIVIAALAIKSRNLPPHQTYQWDPISLFRGSPLVWVFLLTAFLLGFVWEYRRTISS